MFGVGVGYDARHLGGVAPSHQEAYVLEDMLALGAAITRNLPASSLSSIRRIFRTTTGLKQGALEHTQKQLDVGVQLEAHGYEIWDTASVTMKLPNGDAPLDAAHADEAHYHSFIYSEFVTQLYSLLC